MIRFRLTNMKRNKSWVKKDTSDGKYQVTFTSSGRLKTTDIDSHECNLLRSACTTFCFSYNFSLKKIKFINWHKKLF